MKDDTEEVEEIEQYEEPSVSVQCYGPPKCTFNSYEIKRCLSNGGCRWCRKIFYNQNGETFIIAPGNA